MGKRRPALRFGGLCAEHAAEGSLRRAAVARIAGADVDAAIYADPYRCGSVGGLLVRSGRYLLRRDREGTSQQACRRQARCEGRARSGVEGSRVERAVEQSPQPPPPPPPPPPNQLLSFPVRRSQGGGHLGWVHPSSSSTCFQKSHMPSFTTRKGALGVSPPVQLVHLFSKVPREGLASFQRSERRRGRSRVGTA